MRDEVESCPALQSVIRESNQSFHALVQAIWRMTRNRYETTHDGDWSTRPIQEWEREGDGRRDIWTIWYKAKRPQVIKHPLDGLSGVCTNNVQSSISKLYKYPSKENLLKKKKKRLNVDQLVRFFLLLRFMEINHNLIEGAMDRKKVRLKF